MIKKEMLEEIAGKKGLINKEHIEKDYFQDLLLFNICKKTNLFIFKGGTCLYKIYNLQRFSEDLDFSLLKDCNAEDIIKEAIKNIEGCKIKEIKKTKDSLIIKISFNGIITKYNTLRIDINLRDTILSDFEIKQYTSDYIDINPFSIRVLSLKEIVAEKVHSLMAREKARDLYDLFFLLKFAEIDKKIINKKLSFFNMSFSYDKIEKRINNLKTLWEKELNSFILSELPEFNLVKSFVLSKLK